jgi:hypothetical protein
VEVLHDYEGTAIRVTPERANPECGLFLFADGEAAVLLTFLLLFLG